MSIRQATKILQGLKGLNVIGGDGASWLEFTESK
jgi:hypothetical protein